jgi:hypothetical protein
MRRHDMYEYVLKALRHQLAKLLIDAGTVDTMRPREVVVIAARWSEIKRLLVVRHELDQIPTNSRIEEDIERLSACAAEAAAAEPGPCEQRMRTFYLELAAFVGRFLVYVDEERSRRRELASDEPVSVEPSLVAAMLRALNRGERADILAEICAVASPSELEQACEIARYVLQDTEWRAIRHRMVDPRADDAPVTERAPLTPWLSTGPTVVRA